jgi:hypothetical protein
MWSGKQQTHPPIRESLASEAIGLERYRMVKDDGYHEESDSNGGIRNEMALCVRT